MGRGFSFVRGKKGGPKTKPLALNNSPPSLVQSPTSHNSASTDATSPVRGAFSPITVGGAIPTSPTAKAETAPTAEPLLPAEPLPAPAAPAEAARTSEAPRRLAPSASRDSFSKSIVRRLSFPWRGAPAPSPTAMAAATLDRAAEAGANRTMFDRPMHTFESVAARLENFRKERSIRPPTPGENHVEAQLQQLDDATLRAMGCDPRELPGLLQPVVHSPRPSREQIGSTLAGHVDLGTDITTSGGASPLPLPLSIVASASATPTAPEPPAPTAPAIPNPAPEPPGRRRRPSLPSLGEKSRSTSLPLHLPIDRGGLLLDFVPGQFAPGGTPRVDAPPLGQHGDEQALGATPPMPPRRRIRSREEAGTSQPTSPDLSPQQGTLSFEERLALAQTESERRALLAEEAKALLDASLLPQPAAPPPSTLDVAADDRVDEQPLSFTASLRSFEMKAVTPAGSPYRRHPEAAASRSALSIHITIPATFGELLVLPPSYEAFAAATMRRMKLLLLAARERALDLPNRPASILLGGTLVRAALELLEASATSAAAAAASAAPGTSMQWGHAWTYFFSPEPAIPPPLPLPLSWVVRAHAAMMQLLTHLLVGTCSLLSERFAAFALSLHQGLVGAPSPPPPSLVAWLSDSAWVQIAVALGAGSSLRAAYPLIQKQLGLGDGLGGRRTARRHPTGAIAVEGERAAAAAATVDPVRLAAMLLLGVGSRSVVPWAAAALTPQQMRLLGLCTAAIAAHL